MLHGGSLPQPQKVEQGTGFMRLCWQEGRDTAIYDISEEGDDGYVTT